MALLKKISRWTMSLSGVFFVGVGSLTYGYVDGVALLPALARNTVDPQQAIVVIFPDPISRTSDENNFALSPDADVDLRWEDYATRLVITPVDMWMPGATYALTLTGRQKLPPFAGFTTTLSFVARGAGMVVTTSPVAEEKNAIVPFGESINITMDREVSPHDYAVILSPSIGVTLISGATEKELAIVPREPLAHGKRYTLSLYRTYAVPQGPFHKKIHTFSFITAMPPAYSWRDASAQERLFAAHTFVQPQILTGKYIDVDRTAQTMTLFDNGAVVATHLISTGRIGMETPAGIYAVENKTPRAWSRQYELFMPYWMAFTADGKYGIHELPQWPGGARETAQHLGTPVSHGCVRLGYESARIVYDWAEIGTPVVIR